MNLKAVPRHSGNIVTRKTGNEYVLVPVTNNIADMDSVYTLNETGAFIWECIDGIKAIDEIISLVESEYETNRETAEKDVTEFMNAMGSHRIIEFNN